MAFIAKITAPIHVGKTILSRVIAVDIVSLNFSCFFIMKGMQTVEAIIVIMVKELLFIS